MKVLNYGSLNIDHVYAVDHIVQPGETISSHGLELFCGGKGLNQSIALARAGCEVWHAGMVGADGGMLLEALRKSGVDISLVRTVEKPTGNALIQVAANGQNSIVLFPGANVCNERSYIDQALAQFGPGDLLLLQNEINLVGELIEQAAERGMQIALNPSPFDQSLTDCRLDLVSIFLMNEVEGEQITGKTKPEEILAQMQDRFPHARTVLTIGSEGAIYQDGARIYRHGTYPVPVVDTTGAGDTFTGYFLAAYAEKQAPEQALELASKAASIAVSRRGAESSIPLRREVDAWDGVRPL